MAPRLGDRSMPGAGKAGGEGRDSTSSHQLVLDPARLAEEQPSTTPPALITSEPTALFK